MTTTTTTTTVERHDEEYVQTMSVARSLRLLVSRKQRDCWEYLLPIVVEGVLRYWSQESYSLRLVLVLYVAEKQTKVMMTTITKACPRYHSCGTDHMTSLSLHVAPCLVVVLCQSREVVLFAPLLVAMVSPHPPFSYSLQ